jgi:hypothetical protein
MIRVPAGGRFEDRTIDGAANPYLAATAILAAGLDGIENEIDPGEPNMGNLYEASEKDLRKRKIDILPGNLLDAVRNLRQDKVLRDAFGKTRRRLPGLLLRREGAGVEGLPRPRQRLGGEQVPGPVLGNTRPGSPPGRATETSANGAYELWSNTTPRSTGSGLVSTGTAGVPFARKGPGRMRSRGGCDVAVG